MSDYGRVRSLDRIIMHPRMGETRKKGKLLKPQNYTNGYVYVALPAVGKQIKTSIHRIVATAFISNPENKREVNHIDGDKKNNAATNLEWSTPSENSLHTFRVLGRVCVWKGRENVASQKAIEQLDMEGNVIAVYRSHSEAGKALSCSAKHIGACVRGVEKSAYGFRWRSAQVA